LDSQHLRWILEAAYQDSDAICVAIDKEKSKLNRIKRSYRNIGLRKDDNFAYSQLTTKIMDYIKIKTSLNQLAVNHFAVCQVFPIYNSQAPSRYV